MKPFMILAVLLSILNQDCRAEPPRANTDVQINQVYQKTIKPIFEQKCFACHNSAQAAPIYGKFGGIYNPVKLDMVQAQNALDMRSDFPFRNGLHLDTRGVLLSLAQSVSGGQMPLKRYVFIHRQSRVNPAEVKTIQTWVNEGIALIDRVDSENGILDPSLISAYLVAQNFQTSQVNSFSRESTRYLEQKCTSCHNQSGSAAAVFGDIRQADSLIQKNYIFPGDPDHSPLIKAIGQTMPLGNAGAAKNDQGDVQHLRDDILKMKAGNLASCVSARAVYQDALNDLRTLRFEDARSTRYISLSPFVNEGVAGILKAHRAVVKTLNSLSWNPKIILPPLVGPGGLLLRIDLRDLGWTSAQWQRGVKQNRDDVVIPAQDRQAVQNILGKDQLLIAKGDYFLNEFLKSPTYEDILYRNHGEAEVERVLEVDREKNLREGRAIRAGFLHSGVSANNRVIERHSTRYGSYWISYDFSDNEGVHNIFTHPESFERNGGEVIFNLPNGMQAYLLVNNKGDYLAKAPINIVSDPERPDRTVANGISCFRCHANGLLENTDQVRQNTAVNHAAFSSATLSAVARDYIDANEFRQRLRADSEVYQRALTAIDASLPAEVPDQNSISSVNQRFEGPLNPLGAACELDMPSEILTQILRTSRFKSSEVSPLANGGEVSRDSFTLLRQAISAQWVKKLSE